MLHGSAGSLPEMWFGEGMGGSSAKGTEMEALTRVGSGSNE